MLSVCIGIQEMGVNVGDTHAGLNEMNCDGEDYVWKDSLPILLKSSSRMRAKKLT